MGIAKTVIIMKKPIRHPESIMALRRKSNIKKIANIIKNYEEQLSNSDEILQIIAEEIMEALEGH